MHETRDGSQGRGNSMLREAGDHANRVADLGLSVRGRGGQLPHAGTVDMVVVRRIHERPAAFRQSDAPDPAALTSPEPGPGHGRQRSPPAHPLAGRRAAASAP